LFLAPKSIADDDFLFLIEDTMNAKTEKQEETVEETENESAVEVEETPAEAEEKEAIDAGKLEEDFNKLKGDYVRLYAEMDNMKKRSQAEAEKTIKFAISSFAKELLGVADNLERAVSAMEGNKESCAELLKGVELTQNELTKVFEKFGIKRFNHLGQKFDPNFERVVQEVPAEGKESGIILSELQAGYTIHDRILREAMVVVAK
jgi:molecular chaperone GrpE